MLMSRVIGSKLGYLVIVCMWFFVCIFVWLYFYVFIVIIVFLNPFRIVLSCKMASTDKNCAVKPQLLLTDAALHKNGSVQTWRGAELSWGSGICYHGVCGV